MKQAKFIPLSHYYQRYSLAQMQQRARTFYKNIIRRRTVRDFDSGPVPIEIIQHCLMAAGSAPSGANFQPWHFVVISDPAIKTLIRQQAEREEQEFYLHRAPQAWLDALAPLGTDADKPFLEQAPYLIVVFQQKYTLNKRGEKIKHYYAPESVGIATGMLITALHEAGLATLTHTPSPMGFLNQLLNRPLSEKPFMILVTGFPSESAQVPDIAKKSLQEISTFL